MLEIRTKALANFRETIVWVEIAKNEQISDINFIKNLHLMFMINYRK